MRIWTQIAGLALFLAAGLVSSQLEAVDASICGGIFGVATLNAPGLLRWGKGKASEEMPALAKLAVVCLFLAAGLIASRIGVDRATAGSLIAVAVVSGPVLFMHQQHKE